jgi:hypothetical protein
MIGEDFDRRTLFIMGMALDSVCASTSLGEQHEVRKRVAKAIVQRARSGRTTLGVLTEAGQRALVRCPERLAKSA